MKMRKVICLVMAVLMPVSCFCVSSCSPAAKSEPVVEYENVPEAYWDMFHGGSFDENNIWTTDDEQYQPMIKELKAYCEQEYAGTLIIANDEKVIFAGGWNAQEADGETTVNPFTTYETGSYTKQVTAAAILQLVEQNKLCLEDTMDKFFPQCPRIADVKVEHLLDMKSGIPDFFVTRTFFKGCENETIEAFANGQLPDENVLEIINNLRCNPPGYAFEYSNTNYWLLALILERVTGQPYEEYISKHIFDAYGMESSFCCQVGGISAVSQQEGKDYWKYGRNVRGAGDIHSSACDIIRWDRALFSGKVLGAEMMAYALERNTIYSCGWSIDGSNILTHQGVTDACGIQTTVYKTGDGTNVYLVEQIPDTRKGPVLYNAMKIVESYVLAEQE